jgi:hypothetical protein
MRGRPRTACAAALLSATIAVGCTDSHPAAKAAHALRASSTTDHAGALSVSALRISGWHDESFHYLPALSVTASPTGRSVLVQRVDFTIDDAGSRRLLKGVEYASAPRVPPGRTVELVPAGDPADPAEIASSGPLTSISATVFFTDDEGQSGIVSTAARVPTISDSESLAALVIRRFTVGRRQQHGRFLYSPDLTLAETLGRSHASIRKIAFELLDVGAAGQVLPIWNLMDVPAGQAISLVTAMDGRAPWFEINSSADVSRVAVIVSFVDDAGRGGLVSAVASVSR